VGKEASDKRSRWDLLEARGISLIGGGAPRAVEEGVLLAASRPRRDEGAGGVPRPLPRRAVEPLDLRIVVTIMMPS